MLVSAVKGKGPGHHQEVMREGNAPRHYEEKHDAT